jgi:hypothetical protein
MESIEEFLETPGDKDILVKEVFTPTMFDELEGHMTEAGWPNIRDYWETDYSTRHIVSEFMQVRNTPACPIILSHRISLLKTCLLIL